MKFESSPEQDKKIEEWIEEQIKKDPDTCGAAGGRWTYKFTYTGLGVLLTIEDYVTKEELDVTDFNDFQ